MFKKLKDKIAEELKQSPSKISATVSQIAQAVVSPSSSSIVDPSFTSDDPFSISEDVEETPRNTPTKSGFMSVDLRETPASNAAGGRSRRSSTNSVLSEASVIFPSYDYSGSSFHLQSDLESASELDDSVSSNLTSTSKEQLVSYLRKSQHRYNKYKGRWHDVIKHCKELERENVKAKAILSESQDKALRRIAELKEQCLLEKQAKAHLEEILRNDLEEKDHLIMTLNTKIDLLKLNDSSITSEIPSDAPDIPIVASGSLVDISNDSASVPIPNESEELLKEKIKKLEILLAKCKDAIKISKEKVKEFSMENDLLKKERATNEQSHNQQLQVRDTELSAARDQIVMLQRREEESALSLAETKRTIHSEMEVKEEQIKHLRDNIHASNDERDSLIEKCNQLQNQLAELQGLQDLEITSDNEKQMQELSRVKQEAVKLLQAESSKNISDLKDSWTAKLHEVETRLKDSTDVNKQLEAQCIALQDQVMVLETQNSTLEKHTSALQDQMKDIETRYQTLRDLHNVLETESSCLKDEVKLLESQNIALKDQASSFESHILALLEKYPPNVGLVENSHTLQQKIDDILRNAENHSIDVIQTLQKKIDNMMQEKENTEKSENQQIDSFHQLRDDLLEKESIISSQRITIAELQSSQGRLNDENSGLRTRLCELDDANTHFLDEKTHSMANEAALQSELYNLRISHNDEVNSLRNRLSQALDDYRHSEDKINNLETEKTDLETKIGQLLLSCEQKEQSLEQQIQQNCDETNVLKLKLQHAEGNALEELRTQNVKLFEDLTRVRKQLLAEEEHNKVQSEHLNESVLELTQLQQKVEHMEERHAHITEEFNQVTKQLKIEKELSIVKDETMTKTNLELIQLQERVDHMEELQSQIAKVTEEFNHITEQLQNERALVIVQADDLKRKTFELSQLQEQIAEMEDLRTHIVKVTEESNQLAEQLQKERNLSTVQADDLKKKTSELNQLQEKIVEMEDLCSQFTKVTEECSQVTEQLQVERALSTANADDMKKANSELNQLQEKIVEMEDLRTQITQMTEDLNRVTEQLQNEKELNSVKADDLKKTTSELNQLQEKVLQFEKLQSQIATGTELREREIADRQSETQYLNSHINALSIENCELAEARAKAALNVKELTESLMEFNNLKTALEEMESRCKEFEIQQQSHQDELVYANNQVIMLTAENQMLRDSSDIIAENNSVAWAEREIHFEDLRASDSERSMHVAMLKERCLEMEKEVAILKENNQVLHSELANLQSERVMYDTVINDNQDVITWMKTEIRMMTSRFSNEWDDNEGLNSERNQVESASAINDLVHQSQSEELHEIEKNNFKDELKALGLAMKELKIANHELQSELKAIQSAKAIEEEKLVLIQQQMQESLVTIQLKDKEIGDLEETHVSNISQLAKEFQCTLNNKEEELTKAHEDEKAGMEHSEGIQMKQLRDQVKSMKSEARDREEMMDSLRDTHNKAMKALELELASADKRIEDLRQTSQSELREADKKWRQCLDREIEQREVSHNEEVQALSNEWQLERKDPKFTEQAHAQELSSTGQVAVAAVESGTGSIDLLRRQLMALSKELKEVKRCHKLEIAEMRQLMAMQGSEGPTEMEYLRNILFEYMMGREPTVLARVIAAVLKFDAEQTSKIIEKEEHKQTLVRAKSTAFY